MKIITMRKSKHQQKGLKDFIDYIDKISPVKDLNLIEIGSYQGESTAEFAKRFKTVIAVDPWVCGYDDSDRASKNNGDIVENAFDERMSEFTNVTKKKMKSLEYVEGVEDSSIDVVYIDGDHRPEAVLKDIKAWMPKIKPNGFLTGHDGKRKGLCKSITECNLKKDVDFVDSSWLIKL
jgi:predicted O-methyltransferase YrrM